MYTIKPPYIAQQVMQREKKSVEYSVTITEEVQIMNKFKGCNKVGWEIMATHLRVVRLMV